MHKIHTLRHRLAVRTWMGRYSVEALVWLTTAALLVRFVPFRWWSRYLGTTSNTSSREGNLIPRIRRVRWALIIARRHLPWHSTCLMDATAGKLMLNRRRIGSTLYLGVQGSSSTTRLRIEAHAWLCCGSFFVIGEADHESFTVIGTFTTPLSKSASGG